MDTGVVAADSAFVDQRLDIRVDVGDLLEAAVAQQISTGVADVRHGEGSSGPVQNGGGRAHPLAGGVLDGEAPDPIIGRFDGDNERVDGDVDVVGNRKVGIHDLVDRGLA